MLACARATDMEGGGRSGLGPYSLLGDWSSSSISNRARRSSWAGRPCQVPGGQLPDDASTLGNVAMR